MKQQIQAPLALAVALVMIASATACSSSSREQTSTKGNIPSESSVRDTSNTERPVSTNTEAGNLDKFSGDTTQPGQTNYNSGLRQPGKGTYEQGGGLSAPQGSANGSTQGTSGGSQ